jgi:hypothetical protein
MNPATSTPAAAKSARGINLQTPGPLRPIPADPYKDFTHILISDCEGGGALGHSPKTTEAQVGYTRYRATEARLLASAYTAFDKAGRALGMDAAELAEKIDLERLISVAGNALQCLDRWPETDLPSGSVKEACILETRAHLRNMLAKLPLRAD